MGSALGFPLLDYCLARYVFKCSIAMLITSSFALLEHSSGLCSQSHLHLTLHFVHMYPYSIMTDVSDETIELKDETLTFTVRGLL